jgi:hypothetical protein
MSTIEEYINNIDPNLLAFIKENNLIVSGSSALYYYMIENDLDPGFKPTDLDIYCHLDNKIDEYVTNNNYKIIKPYNITNESYCGFLVMITEYNNIKIDFIEPLPIKDNYYEDKKQNYMITYINITFDFDFCKCYYDGEKLIALYPESVKSKNSVLNFKYDEQKYTRFYSYLTFVELDNYEQNNVFNKMEWNYDNDKLNIIRRVTKYKLRGFTIDLSDILNLFNNYKYYDLNNYLTEDINNYYDTCYLVSKTYRYYNLNDSVLSHYIRLFAELRYKYLYVDIHKEIIELYWNPKNLEKLIENGEID